MPAIIAQRSHPRRLQPHFLPSLAILLTQACPSDTTWNATERLVVAFQVVATGIADAHNSESSGIPSIAHTDITTSVYFSMRVPSLWRNLV